MSYFPGMQKGNLDSVNTDEHGKIKKETVVLKGVAVTRVTFDIGAKWSNDLKDYAGTNSCQLPHVALVLSGTLRVVMDDGSEMEFGPLSNSRTRRASSTLAGSCSCRQRQ